MGGIGIWQLAIVFVIVILVFGTKKLKNLGGDLGGALKGFKDAMGDEDKDKEDAASQTQLSEEGEVESKGETIDVTAETVEETKS